MPNEKPYSKRELDSKFEGVAGKVDEGFKDLRTLIENIRDQEIKPVREQTTKTNGRVTALEKGQWLAMGSIAVLTPIVLGLSTWVLIQVVTLRQDLKEEARAALRDVISSDYDAVPISPTK